MAASRKPAPEAAPAVREVAREPVREAAGSVMGHNQPPRGRASAIGRDGMPIWRHGSPHDGHDKFNASDVEPAGWKYQWKAYTVLNEPDTAYQGKLRSAGWTPVMADVHPGRWMPLGHKGPIIVDGLMLMETPMELYLEAVNEEKRMAAEKVNRSRAQHGLAPVTPGVDQGHHGVRQNTFVRSQVETGADIPRPKYERQPID